MLAGRRELRQLLASVNEELIERERSRPRRGEIRRFLQAEIGSLRQVSPCSGKEIQQLAGGRPLVGVDGSLCGYGGIFPHTIHFFRGLAASTFLPVEEGLSQVDVFSPILPPHFAQIEKVMEEAREEGEQLSAEAALGRVVRSRLAELEVEVALEAVKEYSPFLVLFDGGFLRYGELAPDRWEEYREAALAGGVLSVGVIEEVGTFDLARRLFSYPFTGDGDLFFGALEPREWFQLKEEFQFKKTYYTSFARPGYQPQVIAYDFFREQAQQAEQVIPLLVSLTPTSGRGIPLWLDQVDAAARLTRREVELLASTSLDRGLRERFFVSQRERRTW